MPVTCSICCENIDISNEEISVVHCGHLYHQTCLQKWLNTNPTCPDCRAKVGKNGLVKKIYPKVVSGDKISYDDVSNESKSLFKVYEEQAKNMQTLEKDLSKEKLSHNKTLKELEQQKNDIFSLHSELEQLKTENDEMRFAKNNFEQLQLENESLKKSVVKLLQNERCSDVALKHSTSKLHLIYI